MSKRDIWSEYSSLKENKKVDFYSSWTRGGTRQEYSWRTREKRERSLTLLPKVDWWFPPPQRGTSPLCPACTKPRCSPLQRSLSPLQHHIPGVWLQPRQRCSIQPCRSQTPSASPILPWITIPSWRRWWCWAPLGPPSSLHQCPREQASDRGSKESNMTTLLEVRLSPCYIAGWNCFTVMYDRQLLLCCVQ